MYFSGKVGDVTQCVSPAKSEAPHNVFLLQSRRRCTVRCKVRGNNAFFQKVGDVWQLVYSQRFFFIVEYTLKESERQSLMLIYYCRI
jgi:hypothetical protein